MKSSPSAPSSVFSLTVCAMLLVTQTHANYYWDTNGNTAGLGDTAGTWGAAASPGWGGLTGGDSRSVLMGNRNTANTTIGNHTVYFGTMNLALGSTASTIGITAGGVSVSQIVFGLGQGAQGVTLSGGGGSITLTNSRAIIANNSGTNTIGAVLNGTAGLVYGGSGTTVLTGTNLLTGGIILTNGGTLQIGNGTSGSLTSQALSFHSGGGTFNFRAANTGGTQAMGALTFANTGATAGEGTVISTYGTSGNASLTFSSLAARQGGATGNFVVSGGTNGTTNKIVLTGASTGFMDSGYFFNGSSYAAYDAGGYVRGLSYGSDANTVSADTITADNHVQLTTSASNAGIALRSLNLAGGGVNYTIDSGSLTVPGILKTGGGATSTISGGTSLTTASNAELVIRTDTSADALTISTGITGTSGGLTKTGKGTLTLSGSNGYTGVTRILDGTLTVSGGSAIADNQQVLLANAAGATFKLNSNETISNVYGGGFYGGNVDVQGNTLTLSSGGGVTYGGRFIGTSAGGIIKQGANQLTLTNKNTFAGTFTIEAGSVEFQYGNDGTGSQIALSSGGAFNMANGTTLRFNPTANLAWGTFGSQLQSANGGSPAYPYGWIFANDIKVTDGTAEIRVTGNENTVRFTGNVMGGSTGNQTLAFYAGGLAVGSGDRQANTFAGIIQDGTGGTLGVNIDFFGASATTQAISVNLSGQNTFTGPLVVTNSKGLVTGPTTGGYVAIGGEIYNGNGVLVAGNGYLGGGNYTNSISLATGTTLVYLSSANQILGGVISGGGALRKEATGILTLSGNNNYTGGSTINSGTLVFRNTGSRSLSGTHAFAAGTTIGLGVGGSGFFSSSDVISAFGSGTILTNVTVTATTNVAVDTTAGDFAMGGGISGSPTKSLTKLGANTLTLVGSNTYTGATNVNAGVLDVSGVGAKIYDGVTPAGVVTVNSGATLVVGGFALNGSLGSLSTVASNLVLNGGTLRINDTTSVGRALTIGANGGTIEVNTTGYLMNYNASLLNAYTDNSTLTLSGTGSANMGKGITGTGVSLVKAGSGTWTIDSTAAAHTYTGATTVSAGKLVVNGNISTSSLTTVASGATIGGSGTVGALTISTGGFINPGNSPGILTVDGAYIQNGQFNLEIDGLTAGNGAGFHDQVVVNGTVTLGASSILNIESFAGFTPVNGTLLFILLNNDSDAVSGTFSGLAQGATVGSYLGYDWRISYEANSLGSTFTGGNDIALQAYVIPEPKAALLGAIGVLLLFRRRR